MVYYQERIWLKINQRKRYMGQSLGGFQSWHFHCFQDMLPSQYWCVTMCLEGCCPGVLSWTSVSRDFIGVLLCRNDWLSYWFLRCLNLTSRKTDTACPNDWTCDLGVGSVPQITCSVIMALPVSALKHQWPTSDPNKGTPVRNDLDYLPEAKSRGLASLWPKINSLWHPSIQGINIRLISVHVCIH